MGSRTTSPPAESSSPVDSGIRKRVCKACDRCRLKKSKCDGSSPCGRCKADNAICVFGERKKSHDKVYPKGYVEMLENQQLQLVQGLQELYRRVKTGDGWTGAPLKETNGTPLTHDILERLGALKQEGQPDSVHFEDDFGTLQSKLLAGGSGYMQREMSFDANSEAEQSPMFETAAHYKPTFTNPFASHFPPTPPMGSPHPSLVKTSSPLKGHMNTSAPQFTHQTQWQAEPFEIEGMDYSYESPSFDANMQAMMAAQMSAQMFQDSTGTAINPCLTMKNWHGPDDNVQQHFQGGIYT